MERHGHNDVLQIDIYEINEAFSSVVLANQRIMNLSSDVINCHG